MRQGRTSRAHQPVSGEALFEIELVAQAGHGDDDIAVAILIDGVGERADRCGCEADGHKDRHCCGEPRTGLSFLSADPLAADDVQMELAEQVAFEAGKRISHQSVSGNLQ